MTESLLRAAREALPLSRAEKKARLARYKLRRYLDKPLTQDEFAARIGVSPKTVKVWEKQDAVSPEFAEVVARETGVPVEELTVNHRSGVGTAGLADLQRRLKEVEDALEALGPDLHDLGDLARRVLALEKQARPKTRKAGTGHRSAGFS